MVVTRGWVRSWHEINVMSNVKQPSLMSLDKARGPSRTWREANEWPGVNHSGLTRIQLVPKSSREKWAVRQGPLPVGLQRLQKTTLECAVYFPSLPGTWGWLILEQDFAAPLPCFVSFCFPFCSLEETNQQGILHFRELTAKNLPSMKIEINKLKGSDICIIGHRRCSRECKRHSY